MKVAGDDHVGVGSDREHRSIPDTADEKQKLIVELSRLRPVTAATFRWPFFISELNHRRPDGHDPRAIARPGYAAQIDKILGGNFRRLFGEVLR